MVNVRSVYFKKYRFKTVFFEIYMKYFTIRTRRQWPESNHFIDFDIAQLEQVYH